jgi:hypothetical protein
MSHETDDVIYTKRNDRVFLMLNDGLENCQKPRLTFGTGVLHLIQINHQPDATIFQFIILTLFTFQHVSGVFPPIIRSSMTAVAASGFTFAS